MATPPARTARGGARGRREELLPDPPARRAIYGLKSTDVGLAYFAVILQLFCIVATIMPPVQQILPESVYLLRDEPTDLGTPGIFDEIYDRAEKDDGIDWIELSTYDNPHLDQTSVKQMSSRISADLRKIRYEGKPMRFSNLIHPAFTDVETSWCFECGKESDLIPSRPPLQSSSARGLHFAASLQRRSQTLDQQCLMFYPASLGL